MATKHTPGPWLAELGNGTPMVVERHGEERGIAWIVTENDADALLIAAAPALADVLEAWTKRIKAHFAGEPILTHEMDALRVNAEAALRRAGRLQPWA